MPGPPPAVRKTREAVLPVGRAERGSWARLRRGKSTPGQDAAAPRPAARAAGLGGLDPRGGVFHHKAALRRLAQALCGQQKDLRVGLGAGDLAAVGHDLEKAAQADALLK